MTVDLTVKEKIVNVVGFHSMYRNLMRSNYLAMEHNIEILLG